jgi:adenylyltransferase/sulfurtransferase
LGELLDRLDELADWKDRPMVVYCHHGMRSAHAIHLLQSLGIQHMSNLQGGIDRWSQEVDPSVARY